jgi:tRNA(Leu) C34 or U34 (ribose-2'-O)-methylase TrmL
MRGFSAIGLYQPKTPENVGSALRAAKCYGSSMLAVMGKRFKRASTDTFKQYRHMPVLEVEDLKAVIPFGAVPVAVELIEGAQSLAHYEHPKQAFYIFGPEDGSIPEHVLEWCRDKVYVPTNGCMNLAATVNVVLYDRMAKEKA